MTLHFISSLVCRKAHFSKTLSIFVSRNFVSRNTTNMPAGNDVYIPRVTQLDSVEFDKEITQVLKSQVTNISKVTPGSFLDTVEPEINALLKFYIWKFSVNQMQSTFGQHLLNLKYEGTLSKHKSYAWCILTIIPSYLKDRVGTKLSTHRTDAGFDVFYKTIQWIQISLRIAILCNLLMFLRDGKYPSIVERVLRMRLVPATKQQRIVGYSFMTRELIWHTLIELLGNMIPLINYYSLQRKVVSLFSKPQKKVFNREPVKLNFGDKCVICKELPILPHHMGCSHVYCFYCIQGNLLADVNFQCPACGFSSENPEALPVPCNKRQSTVTL